MKPLISIVTPNYNGEKYLDETIQSVLAQTYTNWEMIIVDDISTDHSMDVLEKYVKQDERIKYFVLPEKGGASIARNKAIKEAKGEYIAFLDADDVWRKEKLSKQLAFMIEHDYDFCYHHYSLIDDDSKQLGIRRIAPDELTYQRMLFGCSIGCLSVMYRVKKTGVIQIDRIDKRNDDALWITILKQVNVGYLLNDDLALYRVSANSLSSGSKRKLLKYHYRLYRVIPKFNPVKSLFYTFTNIWIYLFNKRKREIKL